MYLAGGTQRIEVESITLDEFLGDSAVVNAVKIDVEGGELEVLQGMTNTLSRGGPPLTLFVDVSRKGFVLPGRTRECSSTNSRPLGSPQWPLMTASEASFKLIST
jgi:hypothetical protein